MSYTRVRSLELISDNISLRSGTSFDGDIVLSATDFIGFNYNFNESLQEYEYTFKLTAEGQESEDNIFDFVNQLDGE